MKVKVVVVYKDIEDEIAEEILWAEKLESGYYRIDNIPFFAPNLAFKDLIAVENDGGVLYFDDLIKSSGHSTIQIIFFNESKIKETLATLESLGCSWEGMKNQLYYSVDVPFNIQYSSIKKILDEKLEEAILDYKESCLSKLHFRETIE